MSKFTVLGTPSAARANIALRHVGFGTFRRAAFVAILIARNAKRNFSMSKKKEPSEKKAVLNRRSMLTTALAAGAALPLVTVETQAQGGRGTRVVVDLGGVDLPRGIADNLENDIRRAVLMAVARAYPRTKFKSLPLGPGTRGIYLQPINFEHGGGMMGPGGGGMMGPGPREH
jgi:hypothetical protein